MIEVGINANGVLEVVMTDRSPTIYLDHWALCAVSENREYSTRLASCVRGSGGTLSVSGFNIAEFTRMTDIKQAENVEELLESVLPGVVFIDCDPFQVIGHEDELIRTRRPGRAPHLDYDMLRVCAGFRPTSLGRAFTVRGLFSVVKEKGLADTFDDMCDTLVERVENLRAEHAANPAFRKNVEALKASPIQHGTRHVLREVLRNHLRDTKTRFDRNHASDLMHAVVPVSYCDVVLLDAHWCTRMAQVEKRIRAAGLTFPMAKCFSGRGNGVDEFLNEFERRVSAEV